MISFLKKKIHSSEVAVGFIDASCDEIEDRFALFKSTLDHIADAAGRGNYVDEKVRSVLMPEMIFWSYQMALGLLAARNTFSSKISENIVKVLAVELASSASEKTQWFPAHVIETYNLISSRTENPGILCVSGLLEEFEIIHDADSATDFGGPIAMASLMEVVIYHKSTKYMKEVSDKYRVIL